MTDIQRRAMLSPSGFSLPRSSDGSQALPDIMMTCMPMSHMHQTDIKGILPIGSRCGSLTAISRISKILWGSMPLSSSLCPRKEGLALQGLLLTGVAKSYESRAAGHDRLIGCWTKACFGPHSGEKMVSVALC